MIHKILRRRRSAALSPKPTIPDGRRVYAVGDVHGRLDLLDHLLKLINEDDAARGPAETTLIFLGDLIDRGPQSAGVIERLRGLADGKTEARFLTGNHEEIFLGAIQGDPKALRLFCRVGGRETVLSYGLRASEYEGFDYDQLTHWLQHGIPREHSSFLARFEDMVVIGDYAFVHAGVRPDIPLEEQSTNDLRWIREPFLGYRGQLGKVIVHGHTMTDEVERCRHRIGIDTGAYRSGRLTALGLEGADTWQLQAISPPPDGEAIAGK